MRTATLESKTYCHPRPDTDLFQATASIHYANGGLATMLAFSAKNRLPGRTLTAWLAEANWDIDRHHSLFGRIENVANDELFGEGDPLHGRAFRVTRSGRSEEHTSELQSLMRISYAVFCLKKKK